MKGTSRNDDAFREWNPLAERFYRMYSFWTRPGAYGEIK